MYHPSFAGAVPYRVRNGPADESDEESHYGRAYDRTPFPQFQDLGYAPGSVDSEGVIPNGRPRSISNPERYGNMNFGDGSAFGSPGGSPPHDRGPYSPPHPHRQPAKSAMRHSRRPTIDAFGSPPHVQGQGNFPFPQAGPRSGVYPSPYGFQNMSMGPQQPMPSPMMFPPQQSPMQMPPPPNMPMPGYGIPPPGMVTPMQMQMPGLGPGPNVWPPQSRSRRHRRRRDDSDEEEEEGIVPPHARPTPMTNASAGNPLPQPPRVLPVPAVSPEGSVLVDSPPAPPRERPPPNPLPVPPKTVISDRQRSAELEAANAEVKRTKEATELAKAKAIARLEADTWRSVGVPIGGDEQNPMVPLIPGVTVPAVLSNVKKDRERSAEERDEGHHHNPLSSLLKRMSTKHRTNSSEEPPPVAPKPPPKRASRPPSGRPRMPTHNSSDIPAEEGIHPRSSKRGTMPFQTSIGPVVNGHQFMNPQSRPTQVPMQYDSSTGEYFDPTNGLWWDPNSRRYYHKREGTIAPLPKGAKDRGSSGLMSMIKRWTTNTAPDDQERPITSQLVLPGHPGATSGLKGVKALGTVPPLRDRDPRKSVQQGMRIYEDHPPTTGPRRRTLSASEPRRPWGGPNGNANGSVRSPNGTQPWISAGSHNVSRVPPANVYFSRRRDPYGGFRLDSEHSVSWAGVTTYTALNWYEAGKFERPRSGLGATGMETGGTFPSRAPPGQRGGSGTGKGFLKGILRTGDRGLKNAKMEYAAARTEESEILLKLRDSRDINRAVAEFRMSGKERHDWNAIWRYKLDEILYLKFEQHAELLRLLLQTGEARIIFNDPDHLLGDGGNVNGGSNNGSNELGQALMRVREIFQDIYEGGERE